jgi:hypothetical protein
MPCRLVDHLIPKNIVSGQQFPSLCHGFALSASGVYGIGIEKFQHFFDSEGLSLTKSLKNY